MAAKKPAKKPAGDPRYLEGREPVAFANLSPAAQERARKVAADAGITLNENPAPASAPKRPVRRRKTPKKP